MAEVPQVDHRVRQGLERIVQLADAIEAIEQARQGRQGSLHRHSAIRFVTPAQRHAGLDRALLDKRADVYEAAKLKHPERWSGTTRNWQPIHVVHLNPDQQVVESGVQKKEKLAIKKAA